MKNKRPKSWCLTLDAAGMKTRGSAYQEETMDTRRSPLIVLLMASGSLAGCLMADTGPTLGDDERVGVASQALSPTRSPWQMHNGLEVTGSNPNGLLPFACGPSQHGAVCEYDIVCNTTPLSGSCLTSVPAVGDLGWGPAPNGDTIGFSISSRVCSAPVTCMGYGDFTYFQTLVDVPQGSSVTQFSIAFSGMDDGSRITIYNSLYPSGLTVPGSYVYLGGSGTSDLKAYVVSGEVNRVVVTQVDDCCSANNLHSAVVVLNGTSVVTATCGNGVVEAGETCDDGNTVTGDGCSATCKTELCVDVQRGVSGAVYDSLISPAKPTKNWGAGNALATGTADGWTRYSLLSFDLSAIPAGAHIMSATATLNAYLTTGQPVNAHAVSVPWSEATVNWNVIGAGGYAAAVSATFPPVVAALPAPNPVPTSADFTALVQAWVNGQPNYGVLLETDPSTTTTYYSSDWPYSDAVRPKLDVCYY